MLLKGQNRLKKFTHSLAGIAIHLVENMMSWGWGPGRWSSWQKGARTNHVWYDHIIGMKAITNVIYFVVLSNWDQQFVIG